MTTTTTTTTNSMAHVRRRRQRRHPLFHQKRHGHYSYTTLLMVLSFLCLFCCPMICYHQCHAFDTSMSSSSKRQTATTFTTLVPFSSTLSNTPSSTKRLSRLSMIKKALTPREEEIQRKIRQLKRQGQGRRTTPAKDYVTKDATDHDHENDTTSSSTSSSSSKTWSPPKTKTDYTKKLQTKLGTKKSQYLGLDVTETEEEEEEEEEEYDDREDVDTLLTTPTLGSLSSSTMQKDDDEEEEVLIPLTSSSTTIVTSSSSTSSTTTTQKKYNINPDLFDDDDNNNNDESNDEKSEQDLVELVERKLLEKRRREMEWEQKRKEEQQQQEQQEQQQPVGVASTATTTSTTTATTASSSYNNNPNNNYLTTGVGGNWNKNESISAKDDLYVPSSSGSWGAFPRPRDISKAYGGGRQVKPGSSTTNAMSNEDATRERLRQYRERVGIEVQSEKDHALEIDEALRIASYAMQRGVYATAVSALEKVTKYCSTNSKLGGKVFLELAMAYEAVGRSGEAMTVYRTLSTCRMEDIKFNAKRLLYGMEAMQFMREEAKNADFSRKKIRNTFIDTTGLANIAQQFDDVYQTAYIDLNSNFYRRLTESVVRSNREARQILLKATGSGEVERLKIVQALRSLSRNFESALEKEMRVTLPKPEPVALMNGKPIVPDRLLRDDDDDDDDNDQNDTDLTNVMNSMDEFALTSAEQMMENLQGEWRLQLIADRRGDGVKYFNNSVSWQRVDTNAMTFQSCGNVGFLTMSQSGVIEFDMTQRVLKRDQVRSSGGGGMLSSLLWANPKDGGVAGAICSPQQIMSVDSILLITQCAVSAARKKDNADKDHYAVWRRVEAGTYSKNAKD